MSRPPFAALCSLLLVLSCGDEGGPTSPWMPTAGGDGADDGDGDGDGDGDDGDDGDDGGGTAGDGNDDGVDDGVDDAPDDGNDDGSGDDGPAATIPEFGTTFTVIGTSADGLSVVRDLEFNPADPTQLWTANRSIHGSVIFHNPGTTMQTSDVRVDPYGQHFMAQPSSFAMGDNGMWACCNESRNEWNGGPQAPDDFMGPTLWTTNLSIHAVSNGGEGSHYDMLHQSPLCMGIAHDSGNKYWAYDGLNGHIVYYDFAQDHGPGGTDHSDGTIRRFSNATITRVADVPSHMEVDHTTGILFIADTGGGRIMGLDTKGGAYSGSLPGNWDGLDEYSEWTGAGYSLFVGDLGKPSGLALHDGRMFVSDNATQEIIAFDMQGAELGRMQTEAVGIMGITVGPEGQLWYADGLANEIVRVDP